jgi:hypothetical protein
MVMHTPPYTVLLRMLLKHSATLNKRISASGFPSTVSSNRPYHLLLCLLIKIDENYEFVSFTVSLLQIRAGIAQRYSDGLRTG